MLYPPSKTQAPNKIALLATDDSEAQLGIPAFFRGSSVGKGLRF